MPLRKRGLHRVACTDVGRTLAVDPTRVKSFRIDSLRIDQCTATADCPAEANGRRGSRMNLGHSRGSRMTLSPTIVAYICTSVRLINAAPILAMATRVDATANAIVARRRASTNSRPMRGVGMLQTRARHCSGDWYTTVPSPVHHPVGRRCAEAEHQQRDPRECDVSQNRHWTRISTGATPLAG